MKWTVSRLLTTSRLHKLRVSVLKTSPLTYRENIQFFCHIYAGDICRLRFLLLFWYLQTVPVAWAKDGLTAKWSFLNSSAWILYGLVAWFFQNLDYCPERQILMRAFNCFFPFISTEHFVVTFRCNDNNIRLGNKKVGLWKTHYRMEYLFNWL